jgi:nucleoside-diphosphate-sugar epimerase
MDGSSILKEIQLIIKYFIMTNIIISGSNGFVGTNLIRQFKSNINFNIKEIKLRNESSEIINSNIYIHLAGLAHDTNNINTLNDYLYSNFTLTKHFFDKFLEDSHSTCFIFMSSVKAASDDMKNLSFLTELNSEEIKSFYGISKRKAEIYILNNNKPNKRIYILRPCMIHGPGNKGNLNLLYKFIIKGLPWPLGLFENKRSYCSIDNLCFIINELIQNEEIPSGVYNISDDESISTKELINLISVTLNKKLYILNVPKSIIILISKIGDFFYLPFNSEKFSKLTESYIVSNNKIKNAINKSLPISAKDGLIKTFKSFNKNA